jgi:HEPN domain-containing protein
MPAISRWELQALANEKAADAELLFRHGRFSNTYYLFGYSVEIALKACVAKLFVADALPDRQTVNRIFTHNLEDLMRLTGLGSELEAQARRSPEFDGSWTIVVQWSEQARYMMTDEPKCSELRNAVLDEYHGVLQWLTNHW